MLNQYAVDIPTLPIDSWWNAMPFYRNAEPQKRAAKHFGTRMENRETCFADPVASSGAPHPKESNPWSSGRAEPIHSSTAEKNENQIPVQDQRLPVWTVSPKIQSSLVREISQ